jgi:hypothetical protein
VLTPGARPTAERRWRIAALGVAWLLLAAPHAVAQQRGPIQLFPDLETETPAPTEAPTGRTVAPTLQSGRADAPSGFRVEGLAPPGIDAIGLAGPAEGGFDQNLWAGSDGEFILALLGGLPVATENPPLRALAQRVLMTGAPVQGVAEPGSILGARAERLLAMGDLEGATALLDRVPSTNNDSQIARLVVQAALLRGDQETTCSRAADIAPSSDAAFWAEVTIYCRLADGDQEGARLALDLLRDQGQTDDAAFVSLAESIAAGEPAAVPLGPGGPSALHVALYRLADLPLPDTALASASPELLAVAAREPHLAAGDHLAVAERAFLVGALSADGLAEHYRAAAPEQGEDVLGQIATAWGPRARALAYNALPEQGLPERGQLLDALWRAAQGSERFLIAELFAAPFAELPVERGRLRLAPSAARALLATERPIPAARWFSLLSADALGDPQARDDLVALTPLFALAGFGGSVAVPEFDSEAMTAWLASTPDAQARAGHLLALLEGIGVPVPDAAWHQLIVWPGQGPMPAPPAPLWRALDRAAAERRLGESVLLALHLLGGQPEVAHPEAVVAGLRGLRAVGLDQEARAIAIATALEMGL